MMKLSIFFLLLTLLIVVVGTNTPDDIRIHQSSAAVAPSRTVRLPMLDNPPFNFPPIFFPRFPPIFGNPGWGGGSGGSGSGWSSSGGGSGYGWGSSGGGGYGWGSSSGGGSSGGGGSFGGGYSGVMCNVRGTPCQGQFIPCPARCYSYSNGGGGGGCSVNCATCEVSC